MFKGKRVLRTILYPTAQADWQHKKFCMAPLQTSWFQTRNIIEVSRYSQYTSNNELEQ